MRAACLVIFAFQFGGKLRIAEIGFDDLRIACDLGWRANFDKSIVREALGLRRELSFVRSTRLPSRLSISPQIKTVMVPAELHQNTGLRS